MHRFTERVSGLDQAQSQAVKHFLEYLNSKYADSLISNEPQTEIDRYWFTF